MSALARFTSAFPAAAAPRLGRGRDRRLALRAGAMALAAAALAAGGLDLAARLLAARAPAAQSVAAAPRWAEVVRPMALYDLAGSEFSKLPQLYRARRRGDGGPREDVMSFGRLGGPKPFLQLSLLRAGPEPEPEGAAVADDLARLAGTRGLTATRIRPGAPFEARLGPFETADLLLWDGSAATPCLGFRGGPDGGAVLRVSGFACGAPDRPMGRAALACALDRLDLVSAGEDGALRAAFVAAARRASPSCIGGPALVARRNGWLDPDADLPPLRGLFGPAPRRP